MLHQSPVTMLMQVLGMISNQHYLYRMTVLVAITSLASVVTHETLYQHMLPVVVNCGKDKVRANTTCGCSCVRVQVSSAALSSSIRWPDVCCTQDSVRHHVRVLVTSYVAVYVSLACPLDILMPSTASLLISASTGPS